MGVYIRGMEMPGSCSECDFLSVERIPFGDYVCECLEPMYLDNEIVMEGRPDWCPLAEVPTPHGDLIDRSLLEVDADWNDREDWYTAFSELQINDAPAVIAEE